MISRGDMSGELRPSPVFVPGSVRLVAEPDDPAAIFDLDLIAWFDPAVNVTTATGTGDERVIDWTDYTGVYAAADADGVQRPKYAISSDGTPELFFDTDRYHLSLTPNIPFGDGQTTWALVFLENTTITKAIFRCSTTAAIYAHGYDGVSTTQRPGWLYGSTWDDPIAAGAYTGWHLMRFWRRTSDAAGSVQVDDEAESLSGTLGTPGATNSYLYLSRNSTTDCFRGAMKDIIIADGIVDDADPRAQQVRDYFAWKYPTLVSY